MLRHQGMQGDQKARGGPGGGQGTQRWRRTEGWGNTRGCTGTGRCRGTGERGDTGGCRGPGNVGRQMQRDAGDQGMQQDWGMQRNWGTLGGHPGTGDHWCWWRRGTGAQGGRAVPPPGQHPPKFRLPAKPPARPGAGGAPSQRGRAVGLPPAPQIYSFYFPGFRRHQRHGAGLAPAAAALPISLIYGSTPKREEEEEGGWGLR